jgi:apolipoprotein N-acyltransferase
VGFALALLLGSLGYGAYRLGHAPFADGPVVAAIQGNIGQDDKTYDATGLLQSYSALHLKAIQYDPQKRQFYGPSPDLVVWPETCCPTDWCDLAPGVRAADAPDGFQRKRTFSRGAPLALQELAAREGADPKVALPSDPVLYRSVFAGRYDKMHLVPFGEYVPLGEWLPFMRRFTPYEQGYECKPGEHWTRFKLTARDGRKFTFGCLICYEDSDPYLARQYVASEPVDFLVNISNDGWFKGTEEHEQHLAICRFRAVEARRAVVRGVNMGVSGLIDPDGRVTALPNPEWSKSKKVDAVVTATVPVDARAPLYARLGDWVPAGCWLAALLGAGVGRVRRPALGARAA